MLVSLDSVINTADARYAIIMMNLQIIRVPHFIFDAQTPSFLAVNPVKFGNCIINVILWYNSAVFH
jgi:hypothetical protein